MTMPTDTPQAQSLAGINVVVGVTGGIAAYKSAELVRLFIKQGAQVRVVMTEAAKAFITPLTFQALSGHPVSDSLLDESAELGMGHIELARWASVIVIAPATADIIARLNAGMANDLLTTLCLATNAKLVIAPAMNEKMWHASVTQANLREIQERIDKLHIFGPAEGEQACGDVGAGRMLEPVDICRRTCALFANQPLKNKKIVITAGPTLEAIDPVRFLSNHSSGKMGFAIADTAIKAGAQVTLISGPVALPNIMGVTHVKVVSAQDMNQAAQAALDACDIFIGTAAVADYRPESSAVQKLKKDQEGDALTISLVENPDIIAGVARSDKRPKVVIAFAAETQDIENYARRKVSKKGVDAVVANDVSRNDIGFGSDHNEILWVTETTCVPYGPDTKSNIAEHIIKNATALLSTKE